MLDEVGHAGVAVFGVLRSLRGVQGVGPGAMVTKETFAEWKQKRLEKVI